MDRFEAMSMLLEVVEQGSLSGASRTLGVPVATLSRKISELEALLATRLLTRTTRKITLTDAGVTYIEAARQILELVGEAEREAAGEFKAPKGDLVVTAPVMFGRLYVLPVVTDFLALYPDINIRPLLGDRNANLADDHIDMAVRIGSLPDSSMNATRVGAMRTVVCASPSLLASHGIPQSPGDLARMPCVSVDIAVSSLAWRFQPSTSAAPIEVAIKPRLWVTSTEAAAAAAMLGAGAARLMLYQVADAVHEDPQRLAGFSIRQCREQHDVGGRHWRKSKPLADLDRTGRGESAGEYRRGHAGCPPRSAQNSPGSDVAFTCLSLPSAVANTT